MQGKPERSAKFRGASAVWGAPATRGLVSATRRNELGKLAALFVVLGTLFLFTYPASQPDRKFVSHPASPLAKQQDGSGTVTGTKQFVWNGMAISEERDASNDVTRRFFAQGEQIGGNNYYFTRDHLGSVREMTDGSATVRASYSYDPYGRSTKIAGDMEADFGFTGHYRHRPSGLLLAPYRTYSPEFGRWISRDPSGEGSGLNLYGYVGNDPVNETDPLGLWGIAFGTMGGSYFNVGWGDPSLLFTPDAGRDSLQGAEAFADAINPFGDPFANNGFYNPCDPTLMPSYDIGKWTGKIELGLFGGYVATATISLMFADITFSAGESTALFYSGKGAQAAVEALSANGAGSTIFDTFGGTMLKLAGRIVPRAAWNYGSAAFAESASDEAILAIGEFGGNGGSVMADTEIPILFKNEVQLLFR